MNSRCSSIYGLTLIALGALSACNRSSADFTTFMGMAIPNNVTIIKMDGNWGNDPWRCWELSPANTELKNKLITIWNLGADADAFHGVATGGKVYCRFEHLDESYSRQADSYRAVGIDSKNNRIVVYFYNG